MYTELKFNKGKIYEDEFGRGLRFKYKGYLYEFEEVTYNIKRGQFVTTHCEIRLTAMEARKLRAI